MDKRQRVVSIQKTEGGGMLHMKFESWLRLFGIDLFKTVDSALSFRDYLRDRKKFILMTNIRKDFPLGQDWPCLGEDKMPNGDIGGHYFHQDLIVARQIFKNNPRKHCDIGSSVYGFVSHVASFRDIEVFDIRAQPAVIAGIKFIPLDVTKILPDELYGYCDSLSCLHAAEHFGLGRYGDEIDVDGHLMAILNFQQILRERGRLYFSVPIGPQRVEFNAHRIFSVGYLLKQFSGKFSVDRVSFIDDNGAAHIGVGLERTMIDNNFGCEHGCGIFELTKL